MPSTGSATLSAIAVLENPRVDKAKTLLFDAHLFFYDDPETGPGHEALVLLRYFNNEDRTFGEVGKYFVHANVSNSIFLHSSNALLSVLCRLPVWKKLLLARNFLKSWRSQTT